MLQTATRFCSMSQQTRICPENLALPLQGVDTHAHIDLPEFKTEVPEILDRARRAGIEFIGNVFLGPTAYADHKDLFAHDPNVFFILGIHPHEARKVNDHSLARIQSAIHADEKIKALGEIGLDYFRDHAPHDVQRQAFLAQLELARDLDLPVVIHSRAAEHETLELLDQSGFVQRPLIWHCFGGGTDLAGEILDRGWQISIPGTVTFPKAEALQKAVQIIPSSRMVLETDCPFLTPEPYRGKRNEPAFTVFTARKVAELRKESVGRVWEYTGHNARVFFGLES